MYNIILYVGIFFMVSGFSLFLYSEMKDNPVFSEISTLKQIPLRISYLEVMQNIIKRRFRKSFLQVMKYPFCFNKIKLIIALLLPKFVTKKIKNY